MDTKKSSFIFVIVAAAGVFLFGCSTPEKAVEDTINAGGGAVKAAADGTGTVIKGGADITGTVVKGGADVTGTVVKSAADSAGGAAVEVTAGAGETANDVGKTLDNMGKEMSKKRNVDFMGKDVQIDPENDKKIKVEF